jgi:hypothetical protein
MTQRVMLLDDENGAQLLGGSSRSRGRLIHSAASFPLLAVSLALYALADLMAGHDWYQHHWFSVQLMSGDIWQITGGDTFLGLSMILLFVELVRSTRAGGDSLVNHALSVLVFIVVLLLFCTQPGYGNSTFFSLMAMTLLDFMAGFIITAMTARRDTMLAL